MMHNTYVVLGKRRKMISKEGKETHDVIGRRFGLDLQAIIVTDRLPNLFAAAGGAHLGAAAPTLESVVTIFNELKHPRLRDPASPSTRDDTRSERSPAG